MTDPVCNACGGALGRNILERLRRRCRACGERACKQGDHTWSPVALGPGVAEFECSFCDATSSGSAELLEQMGFREVELPDSEARLLLLEGYCEEVDAYVAECESRGMTDPEFMRRWMRVRQALGRTE